MQELKEIRINGTDLILDNNLVRGSILPEKINELNRNIIVKGRTEIEGAVYAQRLELHNGPVSIGGAVFVHQELYIASSMNQEVHFSKSISSSGSIVSRSTSSRVIFASDVNAKQVILYNAFVAGSIYADEVQLENCIVVGGVFASQEAKLHQCIVGTFNAAQMHLQGDVSLLLPSAFSIEKLEIAPGARLFNLSLTDLGALYRGLPESTNSGRIPMSLIADEVKSTLVDSSRQALLRSYSVVGRVLAADLVNMDKFQNHFLLTAASLGSQLLRTYDLGPNAEGQPTPLSIDGIAGFFFDLLSGKIEPQTLSASFDLHSFATPSGLGNTDLNMGLGLETSQEEHLEEHTTEEERQEELTVSTPIIDMEHNAEENEEIAPDEDAEVEDTDAEEEDFGIGDEQEDDDEDGDTLS